jgi:hypothetical protein
MKPNIDSADILADFFHDTDFQVETDDFFLYEIGRLIEEDRASFEDEEFRRVIDAGIRAHVEEKLDVRAKMASRLRKEWSRLDDPTRRIAVRTIRALEEIEFPLHNISLIVRTYTAYLFRRLQEAAEQPGDLEEEARQLIERWHKGEILREEMTKRLKQIGRPAVAPLADLLFEAPEDRMASEMAIETLGSIPCPSSARVLAHSILEPILDEDLEASAYKLTRALWPLPRHYVLYTLAPHTHEDLSFRWFQLLIESDELIAVDLILDELLEHSESPAYHEDLKAILELIRFSRDPDAEEKVLAILNSPDTPRQAVTLLDAFVADFRPPPRQSDNPWTRAARMADINKRYLSAAKLFESGRTAEALRSIDSILGDAPGYPFAVALKQIT